MKTLFLDRDGVINQNRPDHVKSWDEFVFLDGALAALRDLHRAGWTTVVITNQAIVHRNIVPQATVDEINRRMMQMVAVNGGRIEAVYYCPHRTDERCGCRKPQSGLLLHAAAQLGLDLASCYLVGDALTDIVAGQAVGCRCALVRSGRGAQQVQRPDARHLGRFDLLDDITQVLAWLGRAERWRRLQRLWVRPGGTPRLARPAFALATTPVALRTLPESRPPGWAVGNSATETLLPAAD